MSIDGSGEISILWWVPLGGEDVWLGFSLFIVRIPASFIPLITSLLTSILRTILNPIVLLPFVFSIFVSFLNSFVPVRSHSSFVAEGFSLLAASLVSSPFSLSSHYSLKRKSTCSSYSF